MCNVSPGAKDGEPWEETEHHSTTFVTFGNAERLVFSKLYFLSCSYAFSPPHPAGAGGDRGPPRECR